MTIRNKADLNYYDPVPIELSDIAVLISPKISLRNKSLNDLQLKPNSVDDQERILLKKIFLPTVQKKINIPS
jgi:hypothetical protein